MGSYVLSGLGGEDIDEQSFEAFLEEWEKSPLHSDSVEKVEQEYFTVWSGNKQRILLSVRVVPKRHAQYVAGIACIIGLILAELLTILILPPLVEAAANWSISTRFFVVAGFGLILALITIIPSMIFVTVEYELDLEERHCNELFEKHEIETSPLISITHCIFFPGDKYVFIAGTVILVLIQSLARFQALEMFRPFLPFLLFLLALFTVFCIHNLASKAIRNGAHLL